VHEERREMPVYALMLANPDRKLGARLRPSNGDCATGAAAPLAPELSALRPAGDSTRNHQPCILGLMPGRMSARGMSLRDLTDILATFPAVRRRVIERTGLAGIFDFDLEWSEMSPNVFIALQEQLGLKLESTKEVVPVLVIDSVNRPSRD
jgi:uncharacterized protein (TIGR03435 family)